MNPKTLLLLLAIFLISGCTPPKKQPLIKLDTKGHTAEIDRIIVTKSKDIISASIDKSIRVWSSATGKEKRRILGQIGTGKRGMIFTMALSPNEEFLAVGGYMKGIRVYNYKTGKIFKILKSHSRKVNDLSFSDDGKYLISASNDKTAKIWSVKDFSLLDTIKFHTKIVEAVKIIKKEGNYFAVTAGLDKKIALYDIQKKKIIKSHTLNHRLMSLATSKQHISVCGYYDKNIDIYNYNLEHIKTIISKSSPVNIAYSPNEKLLIAGNNAYPTNINIYDVNQNYKKIQSFKSDGGIIMGVSFLDNQTAISAGGDKNKIYIWDIQRAKVLKKIDGEGDAVHSVGVKGDTIALGHSDCRSANCQRLQKSINLKKFQMQNLRDTKFNKISTTYGNYSLTRRKGGEYKHDQAVIDIKRDGKTIASITRSSYNGIYHTCYGFYKNYVVTGGGDGHLEIYNLKGERVANLVGHTKDILSIAIDKDRLVSGSEDQTVRIWNLSKIESFMKPQLTLFISKNSEWVVWTPEGFYHSSKGGEKYIGFHINRGAEYEAEFVDVGALNKQLHRPDIIAKVLKGENLSLKEKKIINQVLKIKSNLEEFK